MLYEPFFHSALLLDTDHFHQRSFEYRKPTSRLTRFLQEFLSWWTQNSDGSTDVNMFSPHTHTHTYTRPMLEWVEKYDWWILKWFILGACCASHRSGDTILIGPLAFCLTVSCALKLLVAYLNMWNLMRILVLNRKFVIEEKHDRFRGLLSSNVWERSVCFAFKHVMTSFLRRTLSNLLTNDLEWGGQVRRWQ